jgi:hypothetical protein
VNPIQEIHMSTKTKAPKKPKEAKAIKASAIDGAVQVLRDAGHAMSCQEMVDAMGTAGIWTSPGGKTPAATLYAAILRENAKRGKEARFVKTEPGRFGLAKK